MKLLTAGKGRKAFLQLFIDPLNVTLHSVAPLGSADFWSRLRKNKNLGQSSYTASWDMFFLG